MPEVDGLEFCKKVRNHIDCPINRYEYYPFGYVKEKTMSAMEQTTILQYLMELTNLSEQALAGETDVTGDMAQIKDLLNGFSVVKSFKAEPEAQRQFDVSNQTVEHAKHRRRWSTGQVKTLSGVCGIIMQFGIFIIGAYLAIRGSISGGTMIIFVNLSGCMVNVIYIVPQYWVSRKAAAGLVKKPAQRGSSYRCGENGLGLSGGERQRVFIARCLPRGTPVLLLDEATAALDNQTVFAVTDAILRLDCLTRLVVTHRLDAALMEQYDEIIVLRGGQIQEQGTYAQLMDKKGYFYSLFILAA